MDMPNIICMTPVKNESWILSRFLKCASTWADQIIVADQSTDGTTAQIAAGFPKVRLIENPSPLFSERQRQRLLIDAARQFPSPRLLIALDADEMLTANYMSSTEWHSVLEARPGTVIRFEWVNIRPGMKSYWSPEGRLPLGFMDDGSEHVGRDIHGPRVPIPVRGNTMFLKDIKCLHYQYTNWERMRKKQCWYQCWERIYAEGRSAIDIFRQYHHMYSIPTGRIRPLRKEWLSGYADRGIDMTTINSDKSPWIDHEMLGYFREHGTRTFRRDAIWNFDWVSIARKLGYGTVSLYRDPRTKFERLVHTWLGDTQKCQDRASVRIIQKVLKLVGW